MVLALLGIAALLALGFVVVYAEFSATAVPNELLGLCLGLSLVFIGAALTVVAKRLVVTEELEDDYPEAHPEQQREIAEIVHESGSRITRKRLLLGAGAATGGALGLAALTPVLSLGPVWDTTPLDETPWRRGVRVVDVDSVPLKAAEIEQQTFYTGFPEGADFEDDRIAAGDHPARSRASCGCPPDAPTGRRTGSSPTRRSARTPAARSRCIASRRSRCSSPTTRSSARATTRPSIRTRAGP